MVPFDPPFLFNTVRIILLLSLLNIKFTYHSDFFYSLSEESYSYVMLPNSHSYLWLNLNFNNLENNKKKWRILKQMLTPIKLRNCLLLLKDFDFIWSFWVLLLLIVTYSGTNLQISFVLAHYLNIFLLMLFEITKKSFRFSIKTSFNCYFTSIQWKSVIT